MILRNWYSNDKYYGTNHYNGSSIWVLGPKAQ